MSSARGFPGARPDGVGLPADADSSSFPNTPAVTTRRGFGWGTRTPRRETRPRTQTRGRAATAERAQVDDIVLSTVEAPCKQQPIVRKKKSSHDFKKRHVASLHAVSNVSFTCQDTTTRTRHPPRCLPRRIPPSLARRWAICRIPARLPRRCMLTTQRPELRPVVGHFLRFGKWRLFSCVTPSSPASPARNAAVCGGRVVGDIATGTTPTSLADAQDAIPGLLNDIVITHVLRAEYFDDPADLARLPARRDGRNGASV